MTVPESLTQLLQVCARKTDDFVRLLDNKHMIWLMEIEEAAQKMFSSDFSAEPELMPKTPSQKRRRKKRTSIVPDENRDPSGRRLSRRSSASWSTSVRKLSTRQMNKRLDASIQEETLPPKRVTRARTHASTVCMPVSEKPLQELPSNLANERFVQVKISAEERRSAELQVTELVALGSVGKKTDPTITIAPPLPVVPAAVIATEQAAPVTPTKPDRTAAKLKIADSSTPKMATVVKESIDLTLESPQPVAEAAKELALDLSNHSMTPTGSKSDRRSVRRSIVGRRSTSRRASLANQYSLANKRDSMTREAVRQSIRRSVSKKKATESSSSSSYKSYQSSVEVVDEEVTVKIRQEDAELAEKALTSERMAARTRAFKKIPISNLPDSDQQRRIVTRQSLTLNAETGPDTHDDQTIRRKSYKRAVDELSDDEHPGDDQIQSPPRKKTPSPPCPPSKVVKPPPHMKSFLHTVQKNQLLMMTPGSIGKSLMVKSFIKRNTPLKTDLKVCEKERQRLETLRKKEEAELLRKQKIEEGKKRKQEELKMRRDERLRKVLQARERVEQMEEEKKKKMEQKFAQIDEKSEKVREDRMAEEKAKKKVTAKKQEEIETRRRQEEEARKLKAKQEEEERRHQELLLQKRREEEEEQERQRKLAEIRQERDRQRELQLAAEKEQERLRLERERERLEKEKALQLQRELERAAQEKEQQRREAEEHKRRQQERMEQERQEKLRREMEAKKLKEQAQRLREEQERVAKGQQSAVSEQTLNVTVDIQNSPACQSYEMTPKSVKPYAAKNNSDDYGMDLNSDDSTDDEGKPRKPIPSWASGNQLDQAVRQQYYHPIDLDRLFGTIDSPKLEDMFNKSKPRFYKRTSSAVWHSPPLNSNRQHLTVGYGLKKY
ncbi:inner centromere protein isoform X2 [Mixophyes fleayi]|uniref:inner centromere protein isoform X2 n=1 Tax=Mixophyes fleayi TaxID=3061075 RepID=UPI003F4DFAD5